MTSSIKSIAKISVSVDLIGNASTHSDQAANLISNLMAAVCERLGIKQTRTSGYHPQGNGQVKCTLELMLSMVINDHLTDWDVHLPKVLFAYRTAIHDVTGMALAPFVSLLVVHLH